MATLLGCPPGWSNLEMIFGILRSSTQDVYADVPSGDPGSCKIFPVFVFFSVIFWAGGGPKYL